MKNFQSYKLLKTIQVLSVLALPFILVLLIFKWQYIPVALLAVLFISKIGHSIGQHRFFCHRAFKTDKLRHWLIGLCATLSTTGSSIHYASVHRFHHVNSDKETDLHDPRQLGFFRTFFLFLDPKELQRIPRSMIKDLLRDEVAVFFHTWYWATIAAYVSLLLLINPWLVLFCYVLPAGYSKFISGVQLTFVHLRGYRNFDTSDQSTNSLFWNWVTLGEGLHNNHHARPGEYRFDFTRKAGEFDFAGWLIERTLKHE